MIIWLRQHGYAIVHMLSRMIAQPTSSLLNIFVIALALALPLLGWSILNSVQPLAREFAAEPELTVFMRTNAERRDATELQIKIEKQLAGHIQNIRLVPREQALADLKANAAYADAVSALPNNPLPDALVVRLKSSEALAKRTEAVAANIRSYPKVDQVIVDSAWVKRLEAALRFFSLALVLLSGIICMAVLATLFNTIRMQILAQQEEIKVAQLVGATASFVRRPFFYLGIFSFGLSSVVAIGMTASALIPLNRALNDLARTYGTGFSINLPAIEQLVLFVLALSCLGALGARFSTRVSRHSLFRLRRKAH